VNVQAIMVSPLPTK